MKKPFSKSLYDASDSKAKENMILWLLEKFPKCSINSKETTYFDITLKQIMEVQITSMRLR